MHITIEHNTLSNPVSREKSVFNFIKPPQATETIFQVILSVRLSEEERAICATYKLFDLILFSTTFHVSPEQLRERPDWRILIDDIDHTIGDITTGKELGFEFGSLPEAQAFEQQLKTVHLPKLKQHITSTDKLAANPKTTFEL
jgi:hypothetical protein